MLLWRGRTAQQDHEAGGSWCADKADTHHTSVQLYIYSCNWEDTYVHIV